MPSFNWDSANIDHIAEHGITPEEAEQVIENGPFELARYIRGGEERRNYLGETDEGLVLTVVATERNDQVRVVTAHRANRSMRQRYERLREAYDAEDSGNTEFQN